MASDRGPRLVLFVGLLLGLAYLGYTFALKPSFGVNFRVYRAAAAAALQGGDVYSAVPPGLPSQYTYLYPPVTVLFFLPFVLAPDWQTGYAVVTLVSLLACALLAHLLVVVIERRRDALLPLLDRLLIYGYVVGSSLSLPSLVYGNVNLLLALLVAVAVAALEYEAETARAVLDETHETLAGVALGVAALVKVFPALFGAWWLRTRADRPLGAMVATGVVGLVVGLAVFGVDTTRQFFTTVLTTRLEPGLFAGGLPPGEPYVTIRRPLAALGVPPGRLGAVAAAVLAVPVLLLYRGPLVDHDRLVAILGTLAAVIVFVPSLPLYLVFLYYPLVPLLYLVEARPARTLLLLGGAVINFAFQFDDVQTLLSFAPLPTVVRDALTAGARAVLSVATPPLWGVTLLLLGCLAYRYRPLGARPAR
ncbi:glycosyltransferase family 87 protein [Salinirarus marinus]|uniref:glycosyltransferase family 87 protein n=1 Tax=Salinirarus marinus TaxID=3068310 RepID=UPI003C6CA37E